MSRHAERLVSAAIVRLGETHHGHRSHADVRRALGDTDPYIPKGADLEGFYTSENRFVTRRQAVPIAIGAGQISSSWKGVSRELLSSDINWKIAEPEKESRQVQRAKKRAKAKLRPPRY